MAYASAYASTLETTLCTAASRAIREALSIEEPIEDQQVRISIYNRFKIEKIKFLQAVNQKELPCFHGAKNSCRQ